MGIHRENHGDGSFTLRQTPKDGNYMDVRPNGEVIAHHREGGADHYGPDIGRAITRTLDSWGGYPSDFGNPPKSVEYDGDLRDLPGGLQSYTVVKDREPLMRLDRRDWPPEESRGPQR